MNYFRCTVGGSGKGNTVTVTCAEEFAGLTITLSKTGKTYTKTCPSTAPYTVTYYGVENGTYTVSCTLDGETYSETVIVQDISCVLNYGFKWQTWVDTASQLDSSDYDTLDEVLEDEKALRELFLEHACVDYMAESTASNEDLETIINDDYCAKWINLSDYALDYLYANEVIADLMDEADKYGYGEWALMPQVPTMTSNTAPFGVASASSALSGYEAYKAFDNGSIEANDSSVWYAGANKQTNEWVGYQFAESIKITHASITPYYDPSDDGNRVRSYKYQGSYNGNDWVDLTEILTTDTTQIPGKYATVTNRDKFTKNIDSYKYYRVFVFDMNSSTGGIALWKVQFYIWAPKGNVPKMISNTAPYGVASGIGRYSGGGDFYTVFDGNFSTEVEDASGAEFSVEYKFTNPVCVKRVKLTTRTSYNSGNTNYIEASNDGITWDRFDNDLTVMTLSNTEYTFEVDNDAYYIYWRIHKPANSLSGYDGFRSIQFYGRELKVSVPAMTSATAPYGEVTWNGLDGGANGYGAFDGISDVSNPRHAWACSYALPLWLAYKFVNPMVLKAFYYENIMDGNTQYAGQFDLQGSNDGVNYTTIRTFVGASGNNKKFGYDVSENTEQYLYYRLYVTAKGSGNYVGFSKVQFYGLDYSEKEFESGTTKKWLYDHGVELGITGFDTVGDDGTVTEDGFKFELKKTNASSAGDVYIYGMSTNLVDFTPYSLLSTRCDVTEGKQDGSNVPIIATAKTESYNLGGSGLASNTVTNGGPLIYLNVSAINQSAYVGTGTGWNQSLTDTIVYEMWLE